MNKKTIESLYLEYVNNFITIKCFAEYYKLTLKKAHNIIKLGKAINNKKFN